MSTVHTPQGARRHVGPRSGDYRRSGWSDAAVRDVAMATGWEVVSIRPALALWRLPVRIGQRFARGRTGIAIAAWALASIDVLLCRVFPGLAAELVVVCRPGAGGAAAAASAADAAR